MDVSPQVRRHPLGHSPLLWVRTGGWCLQPDQHRRRALQGPSRRKRWKSLPGLLVVLVGLMGGPAQAKGQLQCLLCAEAQANTAEDPEGPPRWEWFHTFNLGTSSACAKDPHEMCRVCGGAGGSPCADDVMAGKCPIATCAPAQVALSENAFEITRPIPRLDDRTGPLAARTLATELVAYPPRCDASIGGTWSWRGSGRSHINSPALGIDTTDGVTTTRNSATNHGDSR